MDPPLWNSFFADVASPARSIERKEAMFDDDLNVFQEFDRQTPLPEIMSKLVRCRQRVHEWGAANRVTFDAGKEHLVVLHPSESHGDTFKLLGCMVDPDLRMHTAIEQLLSKIRSESTAILRIRAYYSTPELVKQYKTHVWGLVECHCGAYFHAASGLLEKKIPSSTSFLVEVRCHRAASVSELQLRSEALTTRCCDSRLATQTRARTDASYFRTSLAFLLRAF